MTPTHRQDTYTMPLKQLLELLETTADDTSHMAPRLRRREASPTASHHVPEPTYFRFR